MKFSPYKIIVFICIVLIAGFVVKNQLKVKDKFARQEKERLIQEQKPVLTVKLTHVLGSSIPTDTINEILNERYNVKISDENYDMIIYSVFTDHNKDYGLLEERDPKIINIFYTPEAVLPNLNNYDLTIGFDHVDDPRYIRAPYGYMFDHEYKRSKINVDYKRSSDQGQCNPKKPYFACMLVSGTYKVNWMNRKPFDGVPARISMLENLSKYKRVESGGMALNNMGKVIPKGKTPEFFTQCKFVIAYENQSYDGYVTEKPFQAYFNGAIPIYYGSAVNDLNKKALIYDGDYKTEEELIEYIKKVDNDDDLYCKIWNENIIDNPERNFDAVYAKLRAKLFEVIDAKLKK